MKVMITISLLKMMINTGEDDNDFIFDDKDFLKKKNNLKG